MICRQIFYSFHHIWARSHMHYICLSRSWPGLITRVNFCSSQEGHGQDPGVIDTTSQPCSAIGWGIFQVVFFSQRHKISVHYCASVALWYGREITVHLQRTLIPILWFEFYFIASVELSLPVCLHSNFRNLVTQASSGKQIWWLSHKHRHLRLTVWGDFCPDCSLFIHRKASPLVDPSLLIWLSSRWR